jgi:hypothetical protein
MPNYTDVIIDHPTIDLWTRSLQDILNSTSGSHFGLTPVAIVTKYFFDYSVFDDEVEESIALRQDSISQKISDLLALKDRVKHGNGVYHWKDEDYKKLSAKVKKTLGQQYVQYIEPKLVLICEDKLKGSLEDVMELFNSVRDED